MDKDDKDGKSSSWSTMPRARGGIDAQRLTPNFERKRDPFHAKQLRDQGTTEAERRAAFKAKRRDPSGSRMVKRQRPAPTHKPSPQLARGPDRTAYNDQIARDNREAQRNAKIARGEAMQRELNQHAQWLDRKTEQIARMPTPTTREGRMASEKDLFRAKRQMGDSTNRLLNRAHSVRRDLKDRQPTSSPPKRKKENCMSEHKTNQLYESHRDGALEIAVWRTDSDNRTTYTTDLKRSYKDDQGQWQSTRIIPERDLLKAARLQEQAYSTIQQAREYDRVQNQERQNATRAGRNAAVSRSHSQNDGRER